jgi:predicted dinucleotide-utilizing enzyme
MARAAINVNIGGQLDASGKFGTSINSGSTPDIASVVADTAVLVADAASPTQAHVTTLNGHVGPLNTAITGDLTVTWDTSKITTLNQLKAALAQVLTSAQSGYGGALA